MSAQAVLEFNGHSPLSEWLQTRPAFSPASKVIGALRERAAAQVLNLPFPSVRDEDWRFTDLAPLIKQSFAYGKLPAHLPGLSEIKPHTPAEADACRLVFVDGVYAPSLSVLKPSSGVQVWPLSQVLTGKAPAALTHAVEAELGQHVQSTEHVFAALNTAFLHEGAVVLIPAQAPVRDVIHLLFIGSEQTNPSAWHPRCLVLAGAGSKCTVIEDYLGLGESVYFANAVTEIVLEEGAQLQHCVLQRESLRAFHMASTAISLARNANYNATTINLGARLSRHDIYARLTAAGAQCQLNGLNMLAGRQHADTHSVVDHLQAHGISKQLHKCIVDANARAVFNGKILVRAGAQLTNSAQSSRNLLLSDKARVDTKPELQIDADDVKCTHGATVGQLDRDEVFYLQSRGLHESAARSLLTYAFAAELIENLPVESLKERLREVVLQRTGGIKAQT